jgi:16S rRNA processing protein RimM
MQLVVGRIAKAHGIAGEVSVDVRTDDPDHRYADGISLDTDPPDRGPLVVRSSRWHSGRLLVRFDGVLDRNGADALRGTLLVADSATSRAANDDGQYWDHDLIGLSVVDRAGERVGEIIDVLHTPGSPVLVVDDGAGRELMVPFVEAIVPTVDVRGGTIVIDPPEGLFDQ